MAVRKAITRSKKTFRPKVPSRKNARMMHGEALGEGSGNRLLEISPMVVSYENQAAKEIYYDEAGNPRPYIVDTRAILWDEEVVDIEFKPADKLLNPKTRRKYELVARHYREQGRRFRMMTDSDYGKEPLHTNLRLLNYHRTKCTPGFDSGKFLGHLKAKEFSTVLEAAEFFSGVANVYRLIAIGGLAIDFDQPLVPESKVWIRREGECHDSLRV